MIRVVTRLVQLRSRYPLVGLGRSTARGLLMRVRGGYGYRLIEVGPHPNPAKAADGKKLHALTIDEPAAPVVRRIFAEFLVGHGFCAIAKHLTAPSSPTRATPVGRCGTASAKTKSCSTSTTSLANVRGGHVDPWPCV